MPRDANANGARCRQTPRAIGTALRHPAPRSRAECAVAIAKRELSPGQMIHYKEWFALLKAAGFRVNGKDPLASFLAHISRAPEVGAVGNRTGQYELRAA